MFINDFMEASLSKTVLKIEGLKKSFKAGFIPKKTEILKGISFEVSAGSVTGFLGANGAGKTTTLKCVLELIFADEGKITFFDGQRLCSDVRRRIGFLPERPYFYSYLTGREFLRFYGELSGVLSGSKLNSRIDQMLERVKLTHAADKYLKNYSKGMLQRVGVAQVLIHRPEFIILDEPMAGLDPDGRMEVSKIIQETSKEGTSVFFSSHLLHDAEKLCDRLVILKEGNVCYDDKVDKLLNQVSHASTIFYKKGNGMYELRIEDPKDLQSEIDKLRAEKSDILEIKKEHLSLEEAFVNMAF